MSKEKGESRLKYVRINDVFACFVFLLMIPLALLAKIFVRNFWLIGEDKCEARDNGYWFFKYVRENHPQQKVAYVIDKKCADYRKVKELGKVVQWGGFKHWFWYLTAQKNISSQKGCKPNAAACYLFEIKLRIWRNKRYFLQHGVIMNDLKWLYYDKCYFKLFCVSAKPEYDFVSSSFGYPKGIVECVGLTRFDALHDNCEKKRQVLVMPTWREYLVRPSSASSASDLEKQFPYSAYYKMWSELLCSADLQDMLIRNNYDLMFYPHRNMQRFLDAFRNLDLGGCISIAEPDKIGVQQALKESACLITDYSSVFFDFAYMKKPIIFFQFDEADFRRLQYGEGYLDYHNTPLGRWCDNVDDCLTHLREQIENDCPPNNHVQEFFEIYDNKNCERTYEAIVTH